MSFLLEIQSALLDDKSDIGPVLLKLRLLAAKLGSHPLEEWVKHETEGYPADVPVPDYRVLPVTYHGTFTNAAYQYNEVQIAPAVIAKFGGPDWLTHKFTESAAEIDALITKDKNGGLHLDAATLILKLQGKLYQGAACHRVSGHISPAGLSGIRNAIRSRILSLTIELEKSVPGASEIGLGKAAAGVDAAAVSHITNQVIYGDYNAISNTGAGATLNVVIGKGDVSSVVKTLADAGIPEDDAEAFASIVASEEPESKEQPFGKNAKAWIESNVKKALDGTWKVGLNVASGLLTKVALKYYGLE